MIEQADDLPSGSDIETDLCIVGSGAAGITLALKLAGSGKRILLAEAGTRKETGRDQALYDGEVTDPALHPPADWYRKRMYGGSTTAWGGRCIPFDPIDFAERPWITDHGWPIARDEVARFYEEATSLCEAGDNIYDGPPDMPRMIEGYRSRRFTDDGLERFSLPSNFARSHGAKLEAAPDLRILFGANCHELVEEAGRIAAVRFRTFGGKTITVRAVTVILCVGGIETARLLLANNIGNRHDLVGRNYMCHIAGTVGAVAFKIPAKRVHHGYWRDHDGVYCRRRLSLRPEIQAERRLTNTIIRLHHPRLADPAHQSGPLSLIYLTATALKKEYRARLRGPEDGGLRQTLGHLANVARQPIHTGAFFADLLVHRFLHTRKFPSLIVTPPSNVYTLEVHGEQVPNPDSRITLSDRRDALGMPLVRIDWRHSPLDIESVAESLKLLRQDLAEWGGASLEFDESEVESLMLRDGAYGGHHIGTARMAKGPRHGVVDETCRVFGLDNLYVTGAAVFPTSGQANPTLTIVALALRLAEHLKKA
jgi:choline dehydrogenase-like flavoprotein